MKDTLKSVLSIVTVKNPMTIVVAIILFFILGIFVLVFLIISFIGGGFEVKGNENNIYSEEIYACIYNFDSKEYREKLQNDYKVSKKYQKNLIDYSVEEKADPTIIFAILIADDRKPTKFAVQERAKRIHNKYIENFIFDAYSIIYEEAPYKIVDGEKEKDHEYIDTAMEVVNTLKPAMVCSTKDNVGKSTPGGGKIIIGNGEFSPPLNRKLYVTSPFGYRIHPQTGVEEFHRGVDFDCDTGEPILSVLGGTVYDSKYHKSWGNYVLVDHHNGVYTLYAHMDQRYVNKGDSVETGTILGACGTTGASTGDHLHFETQLNSPYGKLTNPLEYFNNFKY